MTHYSDRELRPTFPVAWLDAPAEQARAVIDEAGLQGADLVAAWIARANAAAVGEVARDDDAPAPARKAARRGLNVLKSRGVSIPEPSTRVSGRKNAGLGAPTVETFDAWFRPPDGSGTSAFTLGVRSLDGRYRLVDVILKEGRGLISIAGMQMSRTQLRESFEGIEKRFGAAPAPVAIEFARARIAEARIENEVHKHPVPLGFDQHRDLLGPVPSPPPPHPADSIREKSAGDRAEVLERSAKLHAQPELRSWLPEPPAMQQMFLEVTRAMASGPSGAEQDAKVRAEANVRAAIEQATDRYFLVPQREVIARRLRDVVVSMLARGATDQAGEAVVVASQVSSSASLPHEIPFLRAFFEKAFGLLTTQMAERQRNAGAG